MLWETLMVGQPVPPAAQPGPPPESKAISKAIGAFAQLPGSCSSTQVYPRGPPTGR
jgi:hypothetical protein